MQLMHGVQHGVKEGHVIIVIGLLFRGLFEERQYQRGIWRGGHIQRAHRDAVIERTGNDNERRSRYFTLHLSLANGRE